MASKVPEEASHTETEDENLALLHIKKKRARRVSFADTEITSVHIFNRDEDYETPPDSKPSSRSADAALEPDNEVVGFFRDLGGDSDDSGDDEGSSDGRKSFLRPMGSPSPGSSTAGSATSNDEDNFFGPVSASFIRPGRLSDSAASEENHEETLDTTAFSMHYRSLARSDSGEVKTPTAVRLVFEDKTTVEDPNRTDSGSFMALTEPKKLSSQSGAPLENVGTSEDSDDMSIVNENPNRYDYGKLSPTLDALLAQSSEHLNVDSVIVPINSKSSMVSDGLRCNQNETSHMEHRNGSNSGLSNFDTHKNLDGAASISRNKLDEANGGALDQIAFDCSPKGNNGLTAALSNHQIQSSNELISGSKKFTKDATIVNVMSKPEFPTTHSGTPRNVDSKVLQFDKCEPKDQHLNGSSVREHDTEIGQIPDQQHRSPMEGSTLMLSARKQQSILSTPISARDSDMVSTSLNRGDFHSNEIRKHNQSILSIQKSISRFRIPDQSYSGSSIKQGIDKLKRRLSKYSAISSPFSSVVDDCSKELQSQHVGAPIACLEEQLFTADLKDEDGRCLVSLNISQVETPRNTSTLSQNKEITDLAKDGEPMHSMSMNILSEDKLNKVTTTLSSPIQLAWSGTKVMHDILISEVSTKKMMFTSETDSALVNDQGTEHPHAQIEFKTVRDLQSPRDKAILNLQSESSENCQIGTKALLSTSYASGTTEPSPLKSPSIQESTLSPFRIMPTQSFPRETPSQNAAGKESTEISSRKNPTESSPWTVSSRSPLKTLPTRSPLRSLPTRSPLRKEPTLRSPKKASSQNSSRKESTLIFPGRDSLQSPHMKEFICGPLENEANQSPTRKKPIENPSRLDLSNATHDTMLSFLEKDIVSPQSNSRMCGNDNFHQGLHISESPLFMKNAEASFERKRTSVEVVLDDGKKTYKLPRIQRSPEVHNSGNCGSELSSYQANKTFTETEKSVGNRTQKLWLDILVKLSQNAEESLSPSMKILNFKAIGMLEDVLIHFLRVKKYEMLGSEIQSQKVADHSSVKHNKRIAETRLLLYKILYEKAKLQLMCAKHEKLLKKVQILSFGIEECQMLKLNYVQLSKLGGRDIQLDDSHLQSCSDNLEGESQIASDTVSTMKQESKSLDGKINSLSNFFHTYSEFKEEPSIANALASVHDYLKRRKCCRLIRQELQLWKVDGFESQNGQYNVLLNYQGYLSQRFTLNQGRASSIVISNQLNDTNILKIFPNMDAHVAFAFVLNAGATKRGVDSKILVQETQATQSLLCNLLDIIEEVQMAQMEIANLLHTNFYSSSGQRLNLDLCFINFHTGIKVTLTLDVTCLNSGVYPSEILPYQVQDPLAGAQKSKSISGEIRSATENIEVGYLRIVRLCRCVSQVLQASSI